MSFFTEIQNITAEANQKRSDDEAKHAAYLEETAKRMKIEATTYIASILENIKDAIRKTAKDQNNLIHLSNYDKMFSQLPKHLYVSERLPFVLGLAEALTSLLGEGFSVKVQPYNGYLDPKVLASPYRGTEAFFLTISW